MATVETKKKKTEIKKVTTKPVVKKVVAEKNVIDRKNKEKKETLKNEVVAKAKPTSLVTDVYSLKGTVSGSLTLPAEYFGVAINKQLIAQAIRVYLSNQRAGGAATKTRGMVTGSTRKIYKQKGTGNARHGAVTAPIFVGGGITFGPVPHSFRMEMPKKMKTRAVASALSHQYNEGSVKIVENVTSLTLKTKVFVQLLNDLSITGKTLVLLSKEELAVRRVMRNVAKVDVLPVSDVHTYAIMNHKNILFSKNALSELTKTNSL